MIRLLLIIYCSIFFIACKKKDNVPDGILPAKKMQAVLWDIMRADQFLADYVFNKDSTKNKKTESIQLYSQVFAVHNISKEEFEKSFIYYKQHPQLMQVIMDSMSRTTTITGGPPPGVVKSPTTPILDTNSQRQGDSVTIKVDSLSNQNIDSIRLKFRRDSLRRPRFPKVVDKS
jgi:hypothetical protein